MTKRRRAGAAPAALATKICRGCGVEKPVSKFSPHGPGRIASRCRPCDAARARAHYWRDVDASRRRKRERRRRNLELNRRRRRDWARTPRGREFNRLAVARYRARHPDRVAAGKALRAAVKRRQVRRASACEVLGCDRSDRLHAHHPNYARPRDVVFVCRAHHEHLHHAGRLPLKPGAKRKFAHARRTITAMTAAA